jgi:beta-phosphoglucomutase-like phosphatase (HAD superfamily)
MPRRNGPELALCADAPERAPDSCEDVFRRGLQVALDRPLARFDTSMSRMRIAALILDLDGLMLDTEPLYKRAWQRAARELGYELADDVYMMMLGRSTAACEPLLLEQFGPKFPLSDFHARWGALWHDETSRGIATKEGLRELLEFADKHNILLAVATSSDAAYTAFALEQVGIVKERPIAIVTGDQVAHSKPAPDIYLEAARRLGVATSECVVLEDSDAGVLAASRAGMLVLLIPDLKPPSEEALAAAHRVFASLDEARAFIAELFSWVEHQQPL